MSQPFVGEIRMFGFPRTPVGWLACDGSTYNISDYEVLYTLLGTAFGGNGQTTFGVPDMRGRVPVDMGQGTGLSPYVLGQMTGTENVTLTTNNLPAHTHTFEAGSIIGTLGAPSNTTVLAGMTNNPMFQASAASETQITLPANTISMVGGNQPHNNLAPTLAVNYCIAYLGIFPSQN